MNMIIIHNFRERFVSGRAHTPSPTKHTWIYAHSTRSLLLLLAIRSPSPSRFKWNWLTKVFRLFVFHPCWMRNSSSKIIIVNKLTMNWVFARSNGGQPSLSISFRCTYFLFVVVQLHWYASSGAMLAGCGKSVCFWQVVKLLTAWHAVCAVLDLYTPLRCLFVVFFPVVSVWFV